MTRTGEKTAEKTYAMFSSVEKSRNREKKDDKKGNERSVGNSGVESHQPRNGADRPSFGKGGEGEEGKTIKKESKLLRLVRPLFVMHAHCYGGSFYSGE